VAAITLSIRVARVLRFPPQAYQAIDTGSARERKEAAQKACSSPDFAKD
jgi:hypothetical protein